MKFCVHVHAAAHVKAFSRRVGGRRGASRCAEESASRRGVMALYYYEYHCPPGRTLLPPPPTLAATLLGGEMAALVVKRTFQGHPRILYVRKRHSHHHHAATIFISKIQPLAHCASAHRQKKTSSSTGTTCHRASRHGPRRHMGGNARTSSPDSRALRMLRVWASGFPVLDFQDLPTRGKCVPPLHSARAGSRAGSRGELDKENSPTTNPRLKEIFLFVFCTTD